MEFVDQRDVFFFLLSNFLDWNSPSLLSRFENDDHDANFDYVDELSCQLPSEYQDIGENIIQFLIPLLNRMPLSDIDIRFLRDYANTMTMTRSQPKSDYCYIFPFSPQSGVSSYAFTVLLEMGCDVSIPVVSPFYLPDMCAVTDILDYISMIQWRMLIQCKYDFTALHGKIDNIERLATFLCESGDTSLSRDEFITLLFNSTIRIERPGQLLYHMRRYYVNQPDIVGMLTMMIEELDRMYNNDDDTHEEKHEPIESIRSPTSIETLDDNTPWETLLSISNRLGITYFPERRNTVALLLQIRIMLASIELNETSNWDELVSYGRFMGMESLPLNKNEALCLLMENALDRSMYISGNMDWPTLFHMARSIPGGRFHNIPLEKRDLISKILSPIVK